MTVRRYEDQDREAVTAFIRKEDVDPKIADDLVRSGERYPLWIAWDDGDVVGVLEGDLKNLFADEIWPVKGQQGWIFNMTAARARRRHRIGTALIRDFADACSDEGLEYIGLMVNPYGDVDGRTAFFKSCGMSVVGYIDGTGPLLMGAAVSAIRHTLARV